MRTCSAGGRTSSTASRPSSGMGAAPRGGDPGSAPLEQLPAGGQVRPGADPARTGACVIYDWKTATHRPKRACAAASGCKPASTPTCWPRPAQRSTRASPIAPEQIEMIYWFAEPGQAAGARSPTPPSSYEADRAVPARAGQRAAVAWRRRSLKCPLSETTCALLRLPLAVQPRRRRPGSWREGMASQMYEPDGPDRLDFDLEQIGEISF